MVLLALVIIFLFLKSWGLYILRSIHYVTFKYGDFQKASRISLRENSISIISIIILYTIFVLVQAKAYTGGNEG